MQDQQKHFHQMINYSHLTGQHIYYNLLYVLYNVLYFINAIIF